MECLRTHFAGNSGVVTGLKRSSGDAESIEYTCDQARS